LRVVNTAVPGQSSPRSDAEAQPLSVWNFEQRRRGNVAQEPWLVQCALRSPTLRRRVAVARRRTALSVSVCRHRTVALPPRHPNRRRCAARRARAPGRPAGDESELATPHGGLA
jgi:hypothetical protein